jgi:hypothetical protein
MDDGKPVHHIVDGKQRLETIIRFANNEFYLGDDFGDDRLNKKHFRELDGDTKNIFWNYQLIVEQLTSSESNYIREIFNRVNRNTRRLTRQEIRHARFEGWFARRVDAETESEATVWRQFGVITPARARRMRDAQFIAEMFILTLEKQVLGFDQDVIDRFYSEYDDPPTSNPDFDIDGFDEYFGWTKEVLNAMSLAEREVANYARTVANFYSLWAILTIRRAVLPSTDELAHRYVDFMSQVSTLNLENLAAVRDEVNEQRGQASPAVRYFLNAQSATTDLGPRLARHEALEEALLDDEDSAIN